MKKLIIVILVALSYCAPKKKSPSDTDIILSVLAYNFYEECVSSYGTLSPAYTTYLQTFPLYTNGKAVIIGDSTMDISRAENPWESSTDNRAISGNTACDFLNQIQSVPKGYETILIASADGNGVLREVPSDISIKTLKKVASYAKTTLEVKNVVIVGIHPIKLAKANERKNAVNAGMKAYSQENGYCFIDMVALFGKTNSDLPDDSQMLPKDNIHYAKSIYAILKSKINTQCGILL